MPSKPTSIDDYLANVPADRRAALEQLRRTIHSILPNLEECISYSMPAFRHEGRVVAGFQATASGCSYYPFSGTTLGALAAQLSAYSQTKSALHFKAGTPLPKALVRRLLAARIAEGGGRAQPNVQAKVKSERSPARASKRAAAKKRPRRKKATGGR
jgi:uncharacterized protein YdhG (YjbR/CyaY superfamily)